MLNKLKYYAKEIISLFVFFIIIANIVSYYKGYELNKEKFDFNNIKLTDNKNFSYDENKAFIVYFWGTWCPICTYQSPNIQELKKDFNVLSIANNSGTDSTINSYLKENNYNFDVLNDKYNVYTKDMNVQVFPTTFIYDKDMNLLFSEVGYTSVWSIKFKTWWNK